MSGQCQISSSTSSLKYYATCGDPVCRGYTAKPGVPLCTPEQIAGAACTTKGLECDPKSDCNSLLRCTDSDPAVMCPISSRRFKQDIEYVDDRGLEQLARELAELRLARYHYKADPAAKPHLGFIIEDQPGSPAVDQNRERVDLYGYTSMAVAALQVQNRRLKAQDEELAAMRREITALKAELAGLATKAGHKAAR